MSELHNQQGSRSRDESRGAKTYSYRHSPRPSSRTHINSPAPSTWSNTSTSRSVSPRGRSPYLRSEQNQESANERWRSWRAPEEPASKTPVGSPTTHSWTSAQHLSPPPAAAPIHHSVEEDNVATDRVSSNDPGEQPKPQSSIWNDDWDEDDQEDQQEQPDIPPRSGWTPEPPEESFEPSKASEEGSIPERTETTHDDDAPMKLVYSYSNNKKEPRNLSFEDIICQIVPLDTSRATATTGPNLRRGAPRQQQRSPYEYNQPVQVLTDTSSPFMYPQFLGKMSPDHYQQYGNDRGGKRWLDYSFDGFSYPEYRSQQEIDTQVTNGYVKIGVLRVNRGNRYDAYVSVNEMDDDIYIGSDLRRNRAFDGDIVAVEFIELEPVWNERKEARRRYASKSNSGDSTGSNEVEELDNDEDEEEEFGAKPKYAGKVVGIVQRQKDRVFVGYLHVDRPTTDEHQSGGPAEDARLWFQPLDRRAPLFYIPHANAPADVFENEEKYKSLLVVAKTISWLANKTRPAGKVLRILGQVGDVNVETEAILAECGIGTEEYSPAALAAIPPLPYSIPQAELSKRLDKRDTLTFTIDPSTAKDLDDALHITPLANGFEVGVHIADVSHFVRPNTPLDTEAKDRGTSTYLIDRVLPMLPQVLCQDLCSLNPGADRLAFSVIWRMDTEARVLETSFAKSIIRSSAKLAYEDAQKVIDGGHLDPAIPRAAEIEECIKNLMELARHRRRRRFSQGALALESLRLSFQLNSNGDPISVEPYAALDAHKLVEEFMLEANTSAAKKISEAFPAESLLRRHRGPIIRRMDQFVSMAEKLGFQIDPESAGTLQRSFQAIPDGPVKQALLTLAIRPMQRAKYFCAGTLEGGRWKHYALNEPVYTHFTSPIRRYTDIIVHRQLDHALKARKSSGYSKRSVQSITHHCNYRKERASCAEEQSSHLYLCRYLSTLSDPLVVSATVIVVDPDFIEIYQPTYGLKNRLFVEDLPLDRAEYQSDENTVVWRWKRGVVVDLETHIRRSHRTSRKKRANNDYDATPSRKSTPLCAPPRELIPSLVHKQHCTQTFSVFSTLDIRLQVNNHRSPPTVDAYPINPFA